MEENNIGAYNRLIQGNSHFTGNFLYDVIKRNPRSSLVMSPFSVLIPLAELALYSGPGRSYNQLMNILNLKSKDEIRSVFPTLISSLKAQEHAVLDLAAKIYVNENYKLTDSFKKDTRAIFEAEAENINFSNSNNAAERINAWVEKVTKNRIKQFVEPSMFTEATRLVLTNAIYFLGNWQSQFHKSDTADLDFHVSKDKTVQVPMMYQKEEFKYAESKDLDSKILEIPYKGGNFSYVAFLPNNIEGYEAVADKLKDSKALHAALDLLQYRSCKVYIPRHEITTSIDLVDVLQNLNVTDIFSTEKAKLTGILANNDDVGVSAAIQKANIKVDETGTEAAAANAFVVGITSLSVQIIDDYIFKADHPFIFFLLLNRNPLFCGIYSGN
ncbi:antichymotrypsin-2-like [Aphomia sociella]